MKSKLLFSKRAIFAVAVGVAFAPIVTCGGSEAVAGSPPAAADSPVLRVCADPDNLPFSSDGAEHGIYIELSDLIGEKLGAKVQYVWWLAFNQKRTLRNTLLAGDCDAYVALPAEPGVMGKKVTQTKPFLKLSYAVVTRKETPVSSAADLANKRLGIQFGSTPQLYFSAKGGYELTTEKSSEALFDALKNKTIDAAFLWGPEAGYLNNTRHGGEYRVVPVTGEDMTGEVAIGVKANRQDLIEKLNTALDQLKPEIEKLAEKYGVPRGPGIELAHASRGVTRYAGWDGWPAGRLAEPMLLNVADEVANVATPSESAPTVAVNAETGREIFNNHCSHCHSADGASPLAERDLRRLNKRYPGKWKVVAEETIASGRLEAGMPTWAGVLSFEEIAAILSFLETIQTK